MLYQFPGQLQLLAHLVVEGGVDRVRARVQVVLVEEVVVARVDVRPVAHDEELRGRLGVRVVPG